MAKDARNEEGSRGTSGRRGHLFRWVFGAIVSVLGLGLALLSYLDSPSDGGEANPSLALCSDALPAAELTDANLGEQIVAAGEVGEIYRYEGKNSALFINLGAENPNQDLTIVIWGENLRNWNSVPAEDMYDKGRTVAVTGRLEEYEGGLEIEVNSPGDAVVCQ